MKSQFLSLLQEKERRTGRRISLRSVARDTSLNEYTVRGFAYDTLNEYPKRAIAELCRYFDCTPGELLTLEDAPTPTPD